MKRVLITGASGFVGANLARRLLQDGDEVHLLLRPGHQPWRLLEIAAGVQVHEADLEDRDTVRAAVVAARPERVFHLAAYGAYSYQTGMDRMVRSNLLGCVALLDACAEAGVEAFVNAGSSSEYGWKDHAPREEEALEPNSHYAITKAAAAHYCRFTARTRDLHAVTVRLYSVYGPYEEPARLIPTLLVHALQGKWPPLVSPDTARDFIYVDDAVEAMLRVAAAGNLPRGSIYNVCTGTQSTLRQVVETAGRLLHVAAEPQWSTMERRAWDTDVWVGDPSKLQRDTGWRAKTSLDAGLSQTVAWLRGGPERLERYSQPTL